MDNDIIIYAKRDKHNSIVRVVSSIFIGDTQGYEEIDKWTKGKDRYLYSHCGNGEYVKTKYGELLFDELGRPNYHGNFVLWTEEEKNTLYPIPEQEPTELEKLKAEQEVTAQALQDLILMVMGG